MGQQQISKTTKYLLTALFVVALLFTATQLVSAKDAATELIARIRAFGAIAPAVYFIVYLVAAISGFSRTVLTIIAGIIFEPVVAFFVVVASTMVAFMCTFALARYFCADWVAERLEKIPVARSLMSAVEENGFRMLVLMRLNPFVPGVVNGYGFGMTSIRPLPYFVASMVGSLPLILIYIYLGWAGGEAMLRAGVEAENLQNGTLLFGVVLSVLMLIAISWYGRQALASVGDERSRHPRNTDSK